MLTSTLKHTAILLILILFSGCGGSNEETASKNMSPIVSAGTDQSVDELSEVTLSGSARDSDGIIVAYQWSQTDGTAVTLQTPEDATTSFVAPEVNSIDVLRFELTVIDNAGATAKSSIAVRVNNINKAPVAIVNDEQTVDEQSEVTLSGSGTDSDGTIISYSWVQVSGPTVLLINSESSTANFTAPDVESKELLVFELTVTDNEGATSTTKSIVNVTNLELLTGEGLVESYNYQTAGFSDAEGLIDITDILISENYISSPSDTKYVIQLQNDSEDKLENLHVSYLIEKKTNTIHLGAKDNSGNYASIYQTENILDLIKRAQEAKKLYLTNTLDHTSVQQDTQVAPVFRFFIQIIMRSFRLIETADTIKTVYDIFNLDIGFKQYGNEVYFEGTIGEFYTLYAGLSSGLRLPLTMSRFVNKYNTRITATRVVKLEKDSSLLDYIKNIAGYVAANSDTQIRVKINTTNSRDRFFSVEVTEPSPTGDMYNIKISAFGNADFSFDFGSLPDFKGWVIIKGSAFEFIMGTNELNSATVIKNVPLHLGDEVTVGLVDEDLFFDDELLETTFKFTGNSFVARNELVDIQLEFEKIQPATPGAIAEKYNISVTITGKDDYHFDIFGNAPDFRGSIIFDAYSVELEVTDDSYTATYEFQNISLSLGDIISVYLEDEDLSSHDKVMEAQFTFDGEIHTEANELVTVLFQFIKS